MGFADLPPSWPQLSLRDPSVARAILDGYLTRTRRSQPGVVALLCNAQGRLTETTYEHVPPETDILIQWGATIARAIDLSTRAWVGSGRRAIVGAIVDPTGSSPGTNQVCRAWAAHACEEAGVELLGCQVVVGARIVPISSEPTAA